MMDWQCKTSAEILEDMEVALNSRIKRPKDFMLIRDADLNKMLPREPVGPFDHIYQGPPRNRHERRRMRL